MTNQTIPPALTAEEWRDGFADWGVNYAHRGVTLGSPANGGISVYEDGGGVGISPHELPAVIALANHALPDGHPLKIMREDARGLKVIAQATPMLRTTAGAIAQPHVRFLYELAAKLAALLPPETDP